MKNNCFIKYKGIWKWLNGDGYYDHDWVYKNSEERKCLKCGEKQIFIKWSNIRGEDWRKKQ